MSDPISLVHDALWDCLEGNSGFTALVATKNRIKFATRDPIKNPVSTADLPEVRLVPATGQPTYQLSSSSSLLVKQWQLQASTGDRRVEEILFPLEWEILRAFADWRTYLSSLTWSDVAFVKDLSITSMDDGTTQADLTRGIDGFATIGAISVTMWFATSNLLPA